MEWLFWQCDLSLPEQWHFKYNRFIVASTNRSRKEPVTTYSENIFLKKLYQ